MQDEQLRLARVGFSTAAQVIAAETKTYIIDSGIAITKAGMRAGHVFTWNFNMTKTAAGVAASTFVVVVGTAGTTADTTILTFTKKAGTAAIDEGWVTIKALVRSYGATGVLVGTFTMIHELENTGHMLTPSTCVNKVSAAFDMTTADLIIGVCITSGAADAITIQQVIAEIR
jgi:hypothetical protein